MCLPCTVARSIIAVAPAVGISLLTRWGVGLCPLGAFRPSNTLGETSVGQATSQIEDDSTNSGISEFEIPTSLGGPFGGVNHVDRSDPEDFPDDADGYDVVDLNVCVEQLE